MTRARRLWHDGLARHRHAKEASLVPHTATFVLPVLAALIPFAATTAQSVNRHPFDAPVWVPGSAPAGDAEDLALLGDLDNDGDIDLLAFTRGSNGLVRSSFRPLFNDGVGNFTYGASQTIPPSSGSVLAIGDVDGDGLLDVLARGIQGSTNGLWVFRSVAGTTWAAPLFVPLSGPPSEIETGNANGDTIDDIFVLHTTSAGTQAGWLLGDTAATFAPGPMVSFASPSIYEGDVADLDGDGLSDFVGKADTGTSDTVIVYRTTPAGLVLQATIPLTSGSSTLVVADIDGDGDTDLQTATRVSSTYHFRLLRNDGAAVFTLLAAQPLALPLQYDMRAVDWDDDGDRDLLTREGGIPGGGPVGYRIRLLENDAGAFVQRRIDAFPENTLATGSGTADLDGNGNADYVEPHAIVFGTGAFVSQPATASYSPFDWDGDGDLDDVSRFLQRNDGRGVQTSVPGFLPTPPTNRLYLDPVAIGDFDGDGRRETLTPLVSSAWAQFLDMRRLEADGDGLLVDRGSASAARIDPDGTVHDFDGDGDPDLWNGQGLWSNDGNGNFTLGAPPVAGFFVASLADLDDDGDLDLLGGAAPAQIGVAYCTGPGTYALTMLATPGTPFVDAASARAHDVDDDGDLDIVTSGSTWLITIPALLFVDNGGTFAAGAPLPLAGRVFVGDFDRDGATDLCIQDTSLLHLLRRVGPGPTWAPPSTMPWADALSTADLDQDGDLDLLGATTLWNTRFSGPTAGLRRQYGVGGFGTGGMRPLLSLLGPLRNGLTTAARVVDAPGGSIGVVFVSDIEANVPNALPGVHSWIGPSFPALVAVFGGAAGQPGAGSVELPIAIPAGAFGTHLFLQCVLLDPAMPIGLGYSNGCELFVGL